MGTLSTYQSEVDTMSKKNVFAILVMLVCTFLVSLIVAAQEPLFTKESGGWIYLFQGSDLPGDYFDMYASFIYPVRVEIGTVNNNHLAGEWEDWAYQVPVSIDADGYDRYDYPVILDINFSDLLEQVGVAGAFDVNSVRVLEIVDADLVEIPSQFDAAEDFSASDNARGEVVWQMEGHLGADVTKSFVILFDILANGAKPSPKYGSGPIFNEDIGDWGAMENPYIRVSVSQNGFLENLWLRTYDDETPIYWWDKVWLEVNGAWWTPRDDLGMFKVISSGPVRVTVEAKVNSPARKVNVVKTYSIFRDSPAIRYTTKYSSYGAKINWVEFLKIQGGGDDPDNPRQLWTYSYMLGDEEITTADRVLSHQAISPDDGWIVQQNRNRGFGIMVMQEEGLYTPAFYLYGTTTFVHFTTE